MAKLKRDFTTRLDLMDHAKFKVIAKAESRSVNNMIAHLVKEKIKAYEEKYGEIDIPEETLYS